MRKIFLPILYQSLDNILQEKLFPFEDYKFGKYIFNPNACGCFLINSDKVVTINQTSGGNGTTPDDKTKSSDGTGTGSTIKYDPNGKGEGIVNADNTTGRPAQVGLGHELGHAKSIAHGKVDYTIDPNKADPDNKGMKGILSKEEISNRKIDSQIRKEQGVVGVPKYVRDYSTLLTGGLTGNLAVTFLGSYGLKYEVVSINDENGTAQVRFYVSNASTIESATHPPVIGYTEFWSKNIGTPLNNYFSTGAMSKTTQTVEWTETIKWK